MKLDTLFFQIGFTIAKYPIYTIVITLMIVALILSGLMFLEFENSPQQLWVDQSSRTNHEQLFFNAKFGAFFRINQIIMKKLDPTDKADLFTPEYLQKIYDLQIKIESSKISLLGKNYTVNDFCYKPVSDQGCLITSPMDFWKMNLQEMINDTNIKETAKCLKKKSVEDVPCSDRNGVPIQIDAVFGGTGCESNEISSDCSLCHKTAQALIVTYLLKNDFYTNSLSEIWERNVFIKAIDEFNESQKNEAKPLKISFMAERSIPDELTEENKQNFLIVIMSYLFMFIYVSISMGKFPSLIFSKILIAVGGILIIITSFLCSISIVSLLGVKMSLISAEVVPFLILAIGVDNMFIIVGAKERINEPNIHKLIGYTLKEVGPSITTAAFSECLAFAVGYMTNIPALQSFCLAATFAVLVDYFLQITVFVALVTFDEMRIKSGRYDLLPCIKSKGIIEHPGDSWLQKFLSEGFLNFILSFPMKIIILLFYIGLIVVSILGMIYIPLGLNQMVSVIQGSNIYNYFDSQNKYGEVGPPAYLVLYNVDYRNENNLLIIDELSDQLSQLTSVKPPVYSWYKDFKKFMDKNYLAEYEKECNPELDFLLTLPKDMQIKKFLEVKINSVCCQKNAICGEQYINDINFNEEGIIDATRLRFQHIALANQSVYIESFVQTKKVVQKFSENFTLRNNSTNKYLIDGDEVELETAFPYSLFYVYYDQYTFIQGISIMNVLIALMVIFIAVQLIMNIKSAFIIALFVFSCVVTLIGVVYLLNFLPDYIIEINAVSVVNLVMACGLSVEFTVHIVIFYLRCKEETARDKIKYAIKNVGASVLVGIVTTKIIGVSVLLFAPSKIFQIYYFRMFFFLILIGFFHGFMLLPIFLIIFNFGAKSPSILSVQNSTESLKTLDQEN